MSLSTTQTTGIFVARRLIGALRARDVSGHSWMTLPAGAEIRACRFERNSNTSDVPDAFLANFEFNGSAFHCALVDFLARTENADAPAREALAV